MDDKTKELLTQIKAYFEQMTPSTETFDEVSRFCIMSNAFASIIATYMVSDHLAGTDATQRLLDANLMISTGYLEMSKLVKEANQKSLTSSDLVT